MFTFIVIISFSFFMAAIYGAKKKTQRKKIHETITRGVKKQNENKQTIQYEKIKALDPDFDISKISARVEHAFYMIKKGWSEHDMSSARGFITEGIYQRYAIQFNIQKAHQRHRKLKDVFIQQCELVGIEADKYFETLHFKISSCARQNTIATNIGNQPNQLLPVTNTVEYWTYIRLPGVKTRSEPGLMEGICPNCGAPLFLSKFEQCQTCGSLVTSGEYDWILAKITQDSEWRFQNSKRQIKGVSEYQVVDPAFNLPIVEDRASVVFWRLQKAWLTQNTEPITSLAHPFYIEHFNNNELNNYYFDHISLGLCEVNSIEFGESFDKVIVLVKWKGTKVFLDTNDDQSGEIGYYAHYLTLVRKTGVSSDGKEGLHSQHCFSCGAPQTETYQERCQYCHTPFNQGDVDWVIKDFSPRINKIVKIKGQSFAIESHHKQVKGKIFDPISLLSVLVLIIFADGKAHPTELELLNEFVKKRRIPSHILDGVMLAHENGELKMLFPDEVLDASAWLLILIEMCLIDGGISKNERKLLLLFGKEFNILAIDIDLRIKEMRRKLYLDATKALSQK